jgi:hypothetical protein
MRFAGKSYYIEHYGRCDKCGMPIYLTGERGGRSAVLCSDWCRDWLTLREGWTEEPPTRRNDAHQPMTTRNTLLDAHILRSLNQLTGR